MTTRQASCSCGQLRLTCAGEPVRISVCHCLECQRRTRVFPPRLCRRPVCTLAAVAALTWMIPAVAAGDERTISYGEMRREGRPEGFYELGFAADGRVCQDALRLLNRPAPMPAGLRMPYDYPKIATAFFLRTEASVTWEPRWLISVIGSKTGRGGVLDETAADIFNTGQTLRLYRFEGSVGGRRFLSIYAAPADSLSPYLAESDDRVEGLPVARLLVPLYELKPFALDLDPGFAMAALELTELPWAGVFADVVVLDGATYVLVTSAIEKYRRNRTYLLRFASHRDRTLICEFRSDYVFVDE